MKRRVNKQVEERIKKRKVIKQRDVMEKGFTVNSVQRQSPRAKNRPQSHCPDHLDKKTYNPKHGQRNISDSCFDIMRPRPPRGPVGSVIVRILSERNLMLGICSPRKYQIHAPLRPKVLATTVPRICAKADGEAARRKTMSPLTSRSRTRWSPLPHHVWAHAQQHAANTPPSPASRPTYQRWRAE